MAVSHSSLSIANWWKGNLCHDRKFSNTVICSDVDNKNIYTPDKQTAKYVNQKLIEMKGY